MNGLHFISTQMLLALLLREMVMQEQVMALQQQVIDLQARIDEMTPKPVPDDDLWHIKHQKLSSEAAESGDLATVERLRDWNIAFARKHIKPYVNPKAYMECQSQMTRGLSERIAKLKARKAEDAAKPTQLALVQ